MSTEATRPASEMKCCGEAQSGFTRREVLKLLGLGAIAVTSGGVLSACGTESLEVVRNAASWNSGGAAPFSRHAHSAAAIGGKLLVMGDRRNWQVRDDGTLTGVPVETIQVNGDEFWFNPSTLDVPRGELVRIVFNNTGRETHDLSVTSANVYIVAEPGETVEALAVFDDPDTFFCSIGGHAEAGMIGDLRVDNVAAESQELDTGAGSTDMWLFDPATDTWERAAPVLHSLDHVSMVSTGDKVYSIGGYPRNIGDSSSEVWAYDPGADSWERVADLPIPEGRAAMAAAFDGERILVAGGRSEPEGPLSNVDVFAYHVALDEWEILPTQLPTARDHVKGTFLDGVFWVVGGRSNGQRVNSTPVTEGYDVRTGEWIIGAKLPVPESAGGVTTIGGRVVVFGGEAPAATPAGAAGRSFATYRDVHAYDPATDSWQRWPDMPLGVHHPAYDAVDGVLVSVGGGPVSGVSGSNAVQILEAG